MSPIQVHEILSDRMLVTRESARKLQARLEEAASESGNEVELDFDGIAGISPSFFDELLATVEETSRSVGSEGIELVLHNPPTNASSKFEAVARGHECSLSAVEGERWILRSSAAPAS